MSAVVKGIADGCLEAECALLVERLQRCQICMVVAIWF